MTEFKEGDYVILSQIAFLSLYLEKNHESKN